MAANNFREKIITLWAVFLLGTLFHTQLGLMPLFHGLSVATVNAHGNSDISWVLWSMLVFFVLPMIAMIATTFTDAKRYKVFHLGLTVVYTVLNFLHVALDLRVQPIVWPQIALMIFLFLVGVLLNEVSYQWLRRRPANPGLNL